MVYAYDQAIQLPVRDIYDTQLMMASINAAKDMYERGQKQIEDFYKSYGDFFSPISSDMDWYEQNVTGAARNFINQLYANGVDPLKSAEGRALIQQFINNTPVGEVNKRKQAAAAAQEYIKARGELEAKGLWNPDYERYLLGGRSLEDWNTETDGLWTRTSPGEFSDLNAATYKWFDKLEPSYLRTENGYDYTGVSPDAVQRVMASNIPGFIDSNIGGYHYELARRQLVAQGITDPTQDQVIERLRNNIQSANSEVLKETRSINPEYAMRQEWEYKKREMALKDYYDRLKEERDHAWETDPRNPANYGGDGDGSGGVYGRNFVSDLYNATVNKIAGVPEGQSFDGVPASIFYNEQGPQVTSKMRDDIRNRMYQINNSTQNSVAKRMDAYKDFWAQQVTPNQFLKYVDRPAINTVYPDAQSTGIKNLGQIVAVRMNSADAKRLQSQGWAVSQTLGQTGRVRGFEDNWGITDDRELIEEIRKNPEGYVMAPNARVYGAPMKGGRLKHYWDVDIYNTQGKKLGSLYWDMNINSVVQPGGYAEGGNSARGPMQFLREFSQDTDRASGRVDSADKLSTTDVRSSAYD